MQKYGGMGRMVLLAIIVLAFQAVPAQGNQIIGDRDLDSQEVEGIFQILRDNPAVETLTEQLHERGFELTGEYYGQSIEYEDEQGLPIRLDILIQDWRTERDIAALVALSISGPSVCLEYTHVSIFEEGNVNPPLRELYVDEEGRIQEISCPSPSFWSCVFRRIMTTCAEPCVRALWSCDTSSWSVWWRCLWRACEICLSRAMACCLCNCHGRCQWAVGCCRR